MSENIYYKNNLGAIHALKGYHHQFIYSLLRIMKGTEQEQGFFPEGKYEDLDIYDLDNRVVEIIQVKSLKRTLTLSDILNSKENSFIRRALSIHTHTVTPKIKLVSFGEVNDDIIHLTGEKYSSQFTALLKKNGLKDSEIRILQNYFEVEVVSEQEVTNNLIFKIGETRIFSDLKITIDLFVYWVYNASRQQLGLSKKLLTDELLSIGKFQNERNNFIKYFGSLIKPLINDELDLETQIKLREDFYKGISAEYNHILANADVLRNEKMTEIDSKLQKSDVVFIHGASGQGKSSLAYRYMCDYCGNTTVFELRGIPTDISALYELINSLEGIAKGVNFPVTIYLDIIPGRKEWVNVIEELTAKKMFKFIVTIRAEDWNAIEIGGKFDFEDIELFFDKEDANLIYQSLSNFSLDLHFVDFDESWRSFGESGPLMEFVYLITQKESLPSKLKQQIDRIRDTNNQFSSEQIKLLRYIALTDFFGAEIEAAKLASYLKLDKDSFLRIMELLEKEYLVTIIQEGYYIKGLHPIRSKIIVDILFDEVFFKKSEYSLNAIEFIPDSSILNFYSNAFRKAQLSPTSFLEKVKNYQPNSWQGYYLILKSLIWKGIEDYVNDNIGLLDDVYQKYGSAWIIILDFNFALEVGAESLVQNFDVFPEDVRYYSKSINERLTNKRNVFKYAKEWLQTISEIDLIPGTEKEWDSFALFTLWVDYFDINRLKINFPQFDFKESIKNISLPVLSHIMYSISLYNEESRKYTTEVESVFLQKLYIKYNIITIQKEESIIDCIYFYDILDEKIETSKSDIIHEKSIQIVELLRFAYPKKEVYKTKGIGHKMSFISNDYDSSVKEIPRENLPLRPFVEINSTLVNLFNYKHRPNNWTEYVDKIMSKRRFYLEIMKMFYSAIVRFYKTQNYSELYSYLEKYTSGYESKLMDVSFQLPQLPKNIVDEWGTIGETQDDLFAHNRSNELIGNSIKRNAVSISKYKTFLKSIQTYNSSVSNFIQQSVYVIIRRMKELLKQDYETIPNNERISVINLFDSYKILNETQSAFKKYFYKYIDSKELSTLNKEENIYISGICFLYRCFVYSKGNLTNSHIKGGGNRISEIKCTLQKKINDKLRNWGKTHQVNIKVDFNENRKSCFIIANFTDPLKSIELLGSIYDCIYMALEQPEYTSMRTLVIESYFSDFCIVPLIRGESIDGKYYIFKSYNLYKKRSDELETFNLMPHDIPVDIMNHYKINKLDSTIIELKDLQDMVTSASTLHHLAFNLIQFQDIEYNELSEDILLEYIRKTSRVFQEQLQKCMDILTVQISKCNADEFTFESDADKLSFYQLLLDTFPLFYPSDELYEKKCSNFTQNPKEMENWLPRLETLKNNVAVIYYFLSGKLIDFY